MFYLNRPKEHKEQLGGANRGSSWLLSGSKRIKTDPEIGMNNNLSLILLVAAVLAGLFFLSSGKKPPAIPMDDRHQSITTDAACAACHAPDKQAKLNPSHPPKEQCLVCHQVKKKPAGS